MYHRSTHLHFMGIGGIGMSGIAYVLAKRGYRISGCDLDLAQKSVQLLQELGCTITHGHATGACFDPSIDVLVYSTAVKLDHPEIAHARQRGIPVVHRSTVLAHLMQHAYSIAVAGAHGKTTTSALIAHILLYAQRDPTIIVGGHLKNIDGNAHAGASNLLVAETDESDRSFLNLPATWAVVTNIDREHLDAYRDLDDIVACFTQFTNQVPFFGKAIVCLDDPIIRDRLLPALTCTTLTYGFCPTANLYAHDITLHASHCTCTVWAQNQKLGALHVPIAGRHHLLNALGATAMAREIGVPFDIIAQALAQFQGVERRFSFHGTFQGAQVFDDYGHHPNEITQTLAVARKSARNKLHVIFQPHRFTRTKFLWDDFIKTFANGAIDTLVITDIYPASEPPIEHINSQRLVAELTQCNPTIDASYIPLDDDFNRIIQHIKTHAHPDDLILCLGAGRVYQIPDFLINMATR